MGESEGKDRHQQHNAKLKATFHFSQTVLRRGQRNATYRKV
jgi:hypothetical protein